MKNEQGKAIAAAAKQWLGTPHVNGAKVKGYGVDCGMLLVAATEDAGLLERDSIKIPEYSSEWHLHHSEEWFLKYVKEHCRKIKGTPQPGDFLLWQYGRCISHGGVYCGDGIVCHALIDQGVILTGVDDVMFYDAKGRSRLRGVYRYKDVKK